jgi:hypothetical protein
MKSAPTKSPRLYAVGAVKQLFIVHHGLIILDACFTDCFLSGKQG